MNLESYQEHWMDMISDWNCWIDHLILIASIIALGTVIDSFRYLYKQNALRKMSLWEWIQFCSVAFVSVWWFRVFTSLYLSGEN